MAKAGMSQYKVRMDCYARRVIVLRMLKEKRSVEYIAAAVGAAPRTIERDAVALGFRVKRASSSAVAERRAKVAEYTRKGYTAAWIARELNICERHVVRDRQKLGISQNPRKHFTEEQLLLAKNLLEDGCPYAEVARTLHCAPKVIMARFPGYGAGPGNPLGPGRYRRLAEELGLALTY